MIDVALVGCGRWGRNHLRVLSNLKQEGIVGDITVVDTSPEARESADMADFVCRSIDEANADLMIIATPSNLHSSQALEVIQKGKHVLVEKPLGSSEIEAAQVIASAQENGVILGVGLLLRFHPVLKLVRNLISNGQLGRIESMRFVRRSTRAYDGNSNVVESLGVHGIDLLCHLMDESEPSAVNVEGDLIEARIALEFPHGIEALIDVAWQAATERKTVTIQGSSGKLVFDLDIHDSVTLSKDGNEYTLQCESKYTPLELEIRHMLNGINLLNQETDWRPIPSHGAALRGVRWTEKAIAAIPYSRPH